MHGRMNIGVVHGASGVAAIGEAAGDADGTHRVETVGILDALTFERLHRGRDAGALERNRGDNIGNRFDHVAGNPFVAEQSPGFSRADGFIPGAEFPVGDVVDQRAEFGDFQIGPLPGGDLLGEFPDALDVVPVMPGTLADKATPDLCGNAFNEGGLG